MNTRLTALSLTLLLAFGAAACDDTVDGVQEDVQDIQEDVEEED